MDEFIYEMLGKYYKTLKTLGYVPTDISFKMIILTFYRYFVYEDYLGLISKEDYHLIERSLNCLYGSSCLIPYPDYLKMGKSNLGSIAELAQRVKKLEETEVMKVIHDLGSVDPGEDSDVLVYADEN